MTLIRTFALENETKNKQRYQEVPDTSNVKVGDEVKLVVGALYISKEYAGTAKSVKVTIEIPDEAAA
jgi:hypothetical protein